MLTPRQLAATTALLAGGLLAHATVRAEDWTDRVFPVKKHDFGTVAVAAKTEFRFPVLNPYDGELHIRSVRTSCGCTQTSVESEYVPAGETGAILARFNTDTFRGQRGATLTVVIDQPFYGEARLRVDGYIRRDMVFHPGELDFGTVEAGTAAEQSATVFYAGREDWKITDIRASEPWLRADFRPVSRGAGKVNYEITVKLREDAPAGAFRYELVIVTDDRSMPRVPFRVSGKIDAPFNVSPQLVSLGSLKPGESVAQRLVIRGREPFLIEAIECQGWDVAFDPPAEPKRLHVLETRFTPGEIAGPQKTPILIRAREADDRAATAKALLTAVIRDGSADADADADPERERER